MPSNLIEKARANRLNALKGLQRRGDENADTDKTRKRAKTRQPAHQSATGRAASELEKALMVAA